MAAVELSAVWSGLEDLREMIELDIELTSSVVKVVVAVGMP